MNSVVLTKNWMKLHPPWRYRTAPGDTASLWPRCSLQLQSPPTGTGRQVDWKEVIPWSLLAQEQALLRQQGNKELGHCHGILDTLLRPCPCHSSVRSLEKAQGPQGLMQTFELGEFPAYNRCLLQNVSTQAHGTQF